MAYRLGLNIGTNSIGWCILDLGLGDCPSSILGAGVRIFPDGRNLKSKLSLAVERRLARLTRRRRDRYLRRREQLIQSLIHLRMFPASLGGQKRLESMDPYALRAKGLTERLSLLEFGRVLFHLNQRRGFKSTRAVETHAAVGKIHPAVDRLRMLMREKGSPTLGAYLHMRREQGQSVRVRLQGVGSEALYEFYPDRALLEEEYDLLWQVQTQYHPQLAESAREKLRRIIFSQSSPRAVHPGHCPFEPTNERAPLALPVAQHFRIYQEVNQLRITTPEQRERSLTLGERDIIANLLLAGKNVSFNSMPGKLGLEPGHLICLEGSNKIKLEKDLTSALLAQKGHYGPSWFQLNDVEQERLVLLLLEEESVDLLVQELVDNWGLSEDRAQVLALLDLPAGYSRLCREALAAVTAQLKADVVSYSEAVARAGYTARPEPQSGTVLDRLPYYGIVLERHIGFGSNLPTDNLAACYGRLANPTVHIALNQLRRVVNELIKEFGQPKQVILEVARDLKHGLQARQEIQRRQEEQHRATESWRKELRRMGLLDSYSNVMRLRLWEELGDAPVARCCPYTGECISPAMLFSPEVAVDYILPFALTLDNSPGGMTVCLRRAKLYKGSRSPYEAFGGSPDGYSWEGILGRVATLPKFKRWRFSQDARTRYEEKGDFLDQQLADTQYIAKVFREYLCAVCDSDNVWAISGRLTSLFSRQWALPRKSRDDYRHHAQDAMVVGVTDLTILQSAAAQSVHNIHLGPEHLLAGLEAPWPGFRSEVEALLSRIIVSHKADHGIAGKLHSDTAYGVLAPNGEPDNGQRRVPSTAITEPVHILAVKGTSLRAQLLRAVTGQTLSQCHAELMALATLRASEVKERLRSLVPLSATAFADRLNAFLARRGIRRVRILETLTLIPIKDRQGRVYKGFKGDSNAYYSIHQGATGKWVGRTVSTFEANSPGGEGDLQAFPLVIRLFRHDMLEIQDNGERKIVYVVKISRGQIALAEHFEANVDKRARDKKKSFNLTYKGSPATLQACHAKPVFVSPAGKLRYVKITALANGVEVQV